MSPDQLYEQATAEFGAAIERLARSYEADPEKRRDLLQEIHLQIWRSFKGYQRQCSLRTWIYRVAHNVAASHVGKHQRAGLLRYVTLEEIESLSETIDPEAAVDRKKTLDALQTLIQSLEPLEREMILLYLEGFGPAEIAEVSGISPGNVATKIHRLKKVLAGRFSPGARHDR